MRTCKFYLYEYKFSNARPLPVHFITTEGVGSHYESTLMNSEKQHMFSTRVQ